MMGYEKYVMPDYEAEYKRLTEENMKLFDEAERAKIIAEDLRRKISDMEFAHDSMETEFARMRAQLDIVYLIFGGHNR